MLRVLMLVLALTLIVPAAGVSAAPADGGPPYTDEQFLALAPYRMPNGFDRILADWWPRAPDYLRKRILTARSEMWWPIILCNFQGFKPEGVDAGGADKCEREYAEASQRGRKSWSADGQWVGPSEECVKRDKRTKWGELICD